jgi:chromosome segregation ATPase
VNLLGNEDIKNLDDLENLLEGKTLKELKESHSQALAQTKEELLTQQEQKLAEVNQTFANTEQDYLAKIQSRNSEINKLVSQLDNTKERLKFHQDNLKTKESIISEYQAEIKQKDHSLAKLQTKQEKLTKSKEKAEQEFNQQLTLTQAKISELETSLFNLAKQKLTNQKQAKALVEQIEKE